MNNVNRPHYGGKYENLCWAGLESSPYMQILYKNQNTHFWKSAKGNYVPFFMALLMQK